MAPKKQYIFRGTRFCQYHVLWTHIDYLLIGITAKQKGSKLGLYNVRGILIFEHHHNA